MKISTKGRYGLRFMLDLAVHGEEGIVTLKAVARRQQISEKYLWQIVAPLKSAGLITAMVGAKGGYTLARDPERITLKDILDPLEGDCALVTCTKRASACNRSSACVAREIWQEVSAALARALDAITLKAMMTKYSAKQAKTILSYDI